MATIDSSSLYNRKADDLNLDFILILPEEKPNIEFVFWDCLKQVTDFEMLLLISMLSSHNVVSHSLDRSSNVSL